MQIKKTLILNQNKENAKTILLIHGITAITLTRTIITVIIICIRRSGSSTIALNPSNHQILLSILNQVEMTVHITLENLIISIECRKLGA
jgi:hypothetical protein